MKARPYAEETYARLSHRERELIKLNGGIDSAAEQTRVGSAQIGRYHNAFTVDEMPVDVVADLEKGLGRPIVSRELVRMLGYEVVKLPEGRWDGNINQQLASMMKESGDIMQKMGLALADDGCISRDECRQHKLRKEIADLQQVLAGMDHALQRIEEGEDQ